MVLSYSSAARQGAAQKVSGPPTTEGVIAGPVRPATPPSVPAPSVPEEETQPIAGPSRLFPSAPEPPFADSSPTGPTITHLILDAGPLLSLEPVRHLASTFHTTPLVLAELKDPKARAHWDALALSGVDVRVEMPSAAAMGKVMEFAKKTGDYAVLSQTDLSVLALTCHWEMELNGDERIRKAPGEKLTPRDEVGAVGVQAVGIQAEGTAAEVAELPVGEEAGPEATTQVATATGEAGEQEGGEGSNGQEEAGSDDDSGGEWITTANVKRHRNRDLGLLPGGGKSGSKPLAAACMTGDYAVQNVLLGMGLGLVGEGGKRISKVKSWVLRCHACFKYVLPAHAPRSEADTRQIVPRPVQALLSILWERFPHAYVRIHLGNDGQAARPPQEELPVQRARHGVLDS